VDSIYSLKKQKSQSKRYNAATQPSTKHPRLTFDVRADRMKGLEEEVRNIKERISYKEKRKHKVIEKENLLDIPDSNLLD